MFWFHKRVLESLFPLPRRQTFYFSIMTVDDSIKCRCANSGMTSQVGGFQNPGVCLQAFPSFLSHLLPALLLAPLFSRSLTVVPRSFLLNRTETLATQARLHHTIYVLRRINCISISLYQILRSQTHVQFSRLFQNLCRVGQSSSQLRFGPGKKCCCQQSQKVSYTN